MPAPRLPICTFETVQAEYERLYKLAPSLAEALAHELDNGLTDAPASAFDELQDELDDIEREIAELEDRRADLETKLAAFTGDGHWPRPVLEQAETVRVLLRQYEGLEPQVLANLTPLAGASA